MGVGQVDTSGWSGDGDLTIQLVEALKAFDEIEAIRVEDAPASRAGTGYNFLANEIYLVFALSRRPVPGRRFGLFPVTRYTEEPALTLADVEQRLAGLEGIGPPDYADEGMLQYLRSERIIPPYQTRGYKQVEMVRIYRSTTNSTTASGTARDQSG